MSDAFTFHGQRACESCSEPSAVVEVEVEAHRVRFYCWPCSVAWAELRHQVNALQASKGREPQKWITDVD